MSVPVFADRSDRARQRVHPIDVLLAHWLTLGTLILWSVPATYWHNTWIGWLPYWLALVPALLLMRHWLPTPFLQHARRQAASDGHELARPGRDSAASAQSAQPARMGSRRAMANRCAAPRATVGRTGCGSGRRGAVYTAQQSILSPRHAIRFAPLPLPPCATAARRHL